MVRPHLGLFVAAEGRQGGGLVLLQHQILYGKTSAAQGAQQAVFVEAQRLQPLGMARTHHQPSALQAQGAAMGGQLGSGDAGPGLPEGGEVLVAAPVLLQLAQAGLQTGGWRRR